MQTQVMFYLLDEQEEKDSNQSVLHYACLQAAYFYRQNQRVFIYTENEQSAEGIDELLWAFDANSFVPHNLAGEGPKAGAMVEISHLPPSNRRAVLINLAPTMPTFSNRFSYVVDFVPTDETLKQQARERFKTCRQWGFQVNNQQAQAV